MKVIKIILTVLLVLLLGGCAISLAHIGNAVNHSENTAKRVAPLWSQIHVGMSEADVRSILGKPDNTSSDTVADPINGGTDTMDMWMYGTLSGTSYSVSFTNGILDSKGTL
jgi:hypothetical protein